MRFKRHPQESEKTTGECEKHFANQVSDKEIVSRVYKDLLRRNYKRQIVQIKMGEKSKQTFLQRRYTKGQ